MTDISDISVDQSVAILTQTITDLIKYMQIRTQDQHLQRTAKDKPNQDQSQQPQQDQEQNDTPALNHLSAEITLDGNDTQEQEQEQALASLDESVGASIGLPTPSSSEPSLTDFGASADNNHQTKNLNNIKVNISNDDANQSSSDSNMDSATSSLLVSPNKEDQYRILQRKYTDINFKRQKLQYDLNECLMEDNGSNSNSDENQIIDSNENSNSNTNSSESNGHIANGSSAVTDNSANSSGTITEDNLSNDQQAINNDIEMTVSDNSNDQINEETSTDDNNKTNSNNSIPKDRFFTHQNNQLFKKFNLKALPGISINDYVKRLQKYLKFSSSVLVSSSYYIYNLVYFIDEFSLTISELNSYRLVLTSLRIAGKLVEDLNHSQKFFAQVCGIKKAELGKLETILLFLLNFNLKIDKDVLNTHLKNLLNLHEKVKLLQ